MKSLDSYGLAWICWLVYFAIVEGIALANTPANAGTFSARVWAVFAVKDLPIDRRRWVHGRRTVLVACLAWLFAHFVSGGRVP